MSSSWKQVLTRDSSGLIDSHGELYGVPARWGAMVIVFRPAEFQQHGLKPIQDWIDLLQPRLSRKVLPSTPTSQTSPSHHAINYIPCNFAAALSLYPCQSENCTSVLFTMVR